MSTTVTPTPRATVDAPAGRAVSEPVQASELSQGGLLADEVALAQHLRTLDKGRLGQEFLPAEAVACAVRQWADLPLF